MEGKRGGKDGGAECGEGKVRRRDTCWDGKSGACIKGMGEEVGLEKSKAGNGGGGVELRTGARSTCNSYFVVAMPFSS